jgi:hypothetical protein
MRANVQLNFKTSPHQRRRRDVPNPHGHCHYRCCDSQSREAELALKATKPLLYARVMEALLARGVRAVPSPRAGEFLFSRDASSPPVVATAVRFF